MEREIHIPGVPIALKRPRLSGKKVYDSQSVEKQGLKWLIKSQWQHDTLKEAIHLDLVFTFPPSTSWSKKKKESCVGKAHTNTPDLDNLVKYVCDLFNGIVFDDDRQVYSITATKVWGKKAGTTAIVMPCT